MSKEMKNMDQLANSDYRLLEKIGEYEESYFEDFLLTPDSILHDFLCYQVEMEPGKWCETFDDLPPMELALNGYTFKIGKLDGCAGLCDNESRTITIVSECVDTPRVLLHEMIHAYINILTEGPLFSMSEYLILMLHKNLSEKIKDLDERIVNHAHMISQEDFDRCGWHGILFYLKSLDLDLRLDLPLGTVCGYGRDTETSP
jgi:hypothetical protein